MVAKLNPPWVKDVCETFADEHRQAVAGMDRTAGASVVVDAMLRNCKVRQQYGESCCGEALSQMASAVSAMQGQRIIYSALAAYYYGQIEEWKLAHDGHLPEVEELPDDGTYPYAAELGWQKNGLPSENTWPHDVSLLGKCPGWGAIAEGATNKDFSMISLEGSPTLVEDIQANIRAGHPCGITVPVDQQMMEFVGRTPLGPRTGHIMGLHRLPLLGLDRAGRPIALNSWSSAWGSNGLCFLTPEFILQQGRDPSALVRADLLKP